MAFGVSERALQLPGGIKLPGKGGIVLSGVCEELSGGEDWVREPGNKFERKTGERTQSVKHLPCRYENLSSDLQNPCKKPGTAAHACCPSTGKAETDRPLNSQSREFCLANEFQVP